MMKIKKVKGLLYAKKRAGMFFCAPFIVGFLLFYLIPLINSVLYSFSEVKLDNTGINLTYNGLTNYIFAFTKDSTFLRNFISTLGSTLYKIPIILLFSLFIGIMINHKFPGRTFIRAMFFLPVIISSGVVINIMTGDVYSAVLGGGQSNSTLIQSNVLGEMLSLYGVRQDIINGLTGAIDQIFELTWRSGIQILLFLASLQAIPDSLYEASSIEGANSWENFWFLTIPMISPVLLVNGVYTLTDTFIDYANPVMKQIFNYASTLNYSVSMAMAWSYFFVISLLLLVLYLIVRKKIYYSV